ncbi:MAG: bifunctional hydroxymethylpyrimidine kinase/phosphomethylpyrimidine kinase [Thermoprotei archaeon]
MNSHKVPVALTIAGSDSGGGAGIQADLKTFAALGVHGTSAITAITAQNTYSVIGVQEISTEIIEKQIDAVAQDMGIDAAKTGMLSSTPIILAVSKSVRRYAFPLVVDPVMVAKSGAQLLKDDAIETLIKELIPLATVVTPNTPEVEKLIGIKVKDIDDAKKAAKMIVNNYGAKASVVKGGHLDWDESVDVLYYDGIFKELRAPKINTKNTHGTGCSFSAAIAAELAKGNDIITSVEIAKRFITNAIFHGLSIGKGHGPVNPISWLYVPAEKYRIIEQLKNAIMMLENDEKVANLIPEVQTNLVMALPYPYAKSISDVAGIPGRIVRIGNRVKASAPPEFGASSHVARAVLKAMEYDNNIRAAANIKFSEEILETIKKLGFTISFYDRREEPPEIKIKEGATIPWGVEQAIKRVGRVPDAIYDPGDLGKEPAIKIFGKDVIDVVNKMIAIAHYVR